MKCNKEKSCYWAVAACICAVFLFTCFGSPLLVQAAEIHADSFEAADDELGSAVDDNIFSAHEVPEGAEFVTLDIADGSIYIDEYGYTAGDGQAAAFDGIYVITGSTESAHEIHLISGNHTVIFNNLEIDQRTGADCVPLSVGSEAKVFLSLCGTNVLYAGEGHGGIELDAGAALNMEGFGEGSLSVLSYPSRTRGLVHGDSAVLVPQGAAIEYPQGSAGDMITMFAGINRKETKEIFVYSGQPYLQLKFDIAHTEHVLSAEADCVHGQICVLCGEEVVQAADHISAGAATCTHPELCSVCGVRLSPSLEHQGVWEVVGYNADKTMRIETMTCTLCQEELERNVFIKK